MTKTIKSNIRVEIKDVEVDDFYFNFKYRVLISDRVHQDWETYESDHSWGNDKPAFKSMLRKGYAVDLVFEEVKFAK